MTGPSFILYAKSVNQILIHICIMIYMLLDKFFLLLFTIHGYPKAHISVRLTRLVIKV